MRAAARDLGSQDREVHELAPRNVRYEGHQSAAIITQYGAKPNYGCFLETASSFCSIRPISGLDMKFFQTSPVR